MWLANIQLLILAYFVCLFVGGGLLLLFVSCASSRAHVYMWMCGKGWLTAGCNSVRLFAGGQGRGLM